ncbi:tyrosine-type recombinase/integrase [Nanoarchaeota archaeon]
MKKYLRTRWKNKLPYVMSKDQLLKLLDYTDDIKIAMMIFVGVFFGLRISEMVRLKMEDIDLDCSNFGELIIRDAKNPKRFQTGYGKDRIVPINKMFLHIFRKWKNLNSKNKYLFFERGTIDVNSAKRQFEKKFHACLKKAGLAEVDFFQQDGKPRYRYHLHTLRHVCGTNLYRAGMDLYQIKEWLGHAHIETTQIYCELAKDDLAAASQRAYAYPKSRVTQVIEPKIEVKYNSESLKLQNENLRLVQELIGLKARPIIER